MFTQTREQIERKKLLITGVDDPRPVGERGTLKLQFRGRDEDGELTYFTFKKDLFETIQNGLGQNINFEVETSVNGDYTNRKVIQAFPHGEPVIVRKGNNPFRADNPEQRQSIESQTAFKIISNLRIADKLPEDHPLYLNLLTWLELRTSAVLPAGTGVKSGTYKPGGNLLHSDNPNTEEKTLPFKNGPELFNYGIQRGLTVVAMKKALGIEKPTEIKDIKTASFILFGNNL